MSAKRLTARISCLQAVSAVWMLLVFLIALPTDSHATKFDEAVSAPRELSGAELRERAQDYFEPFANGSVTMSSLLRNPAHYEKWVDLRWQLGRAIDAKRPLDELAEYGVISDGDGSYTIDVEHFPQWDPLDAKMRSFLSPGTLDVTLEALKETGFRDSDINVLRAYLKNHDPDLERIAQTKPLTESFATRVKRRAAAGGGLDRAAMMAYLYQNHKSVAEASRTWAVGLLNSLDSQRQRILESYLLESHRVIGVAPTDVETSRKYLEDLLLSGRYVEAIEADIERAKRKQTEDRP